MPELPEVETVCRMLEPVMTGRQIVGVELRRADLRVPFPKRFRVRLTGQTVLGLTRRAKYLLARLSSQETLIMHLGMSGSFRVERAPGVSRRGAGPNARAREVRGDAARYFQPSESGRHDHVVFQLSSGSMVTFNDPRRFGLMELATPAQLASHPVLSRLGPEPLSPAFDAAALARACTGKKTPIKAALLDQRVVAGLGNIYASEALHLAGISPLRHASVIATSDGAPRDSAVRLVTAIKQVLTQAIRRAATAETYRSQTSEFRVYDREGEPCRRRGCEGAIRRRVQAGRSTFYCQACQR